MSRGFSAAAVFARAVAVESLPADLRLVSLDWGVYFATDGRRTAAQIGEALEVAPAERDAAIARLVERGLLAERALSAGEYLRAAATLPGEARTLGEFLTASLGSLVAEPAAPEPATPGPYVPEPASPEPYAPEPAVPEPSPEPAAEPLPPEPLDEFVPLPLPEPEDTMSISPSPDLRPAPPLSLRAVMRFVVDQAPDADAGQLDVYRAFVRLDPQLLRRNGITTLRFEEDRLLTDPDLKRALLRSVEQVVGRSCPPEVFVAA